VKDFYAKNGFQPVGQDENCINYSIDISLQSFTEKPYFKINIDK
jgi:hypothetical protein